MRLGCLAKTLLAGRRHIFSQRTSTIMKREVIEAALAESNGIVAGPNGAAAKLGIQRSTLDLKTKQLNIKKHTIR
jgi:transcriptional regulator with GAF, ATPase, and Fis domain